MRRFGKWLVVAAVAALVIVLPAAGAGFDLHLVSQTNSKITLGWDARQNVVNYTFYANGKRVSNTYDGSKTQVTFAKVTCSANPCYRVQALVSDGEGGYPSSSPPPTDTTPPGAPPNVHKVSASQTQVVLGWDAASDNVGVVNYLIYRGSQLIGQGPGSSGGLLNQWTDPGRTCGTSYSYSVAAQDAAGNTGPNGSATIATSACSQPTSACSDGLDNDLDGKIDFPADPGCTSLTDTDETDAVSPPTTITSSQCASRASVAGAVIDNVTVSGGCNIGAANVTLSNSVLSGSVSIPASASGFRLLNSRALGFDLKGADDVTISGNTFDGQGRRDNNEIYDGPTGNTPDRWTISNNTFKNFYVDDGSTHSEALFIGYSNNGLIEGNTFTNNGNTGHIFFTWWGGVANPATSYPRNVCVRNNTFNATWDAFYDINFRDEIPTSSNIKIQSNASTGWPQFRGVC